MGLMVATEKKQNAEILNVVSLNNKVTINDFTLVYKKNGIITAFISFTVSDTLTGWTDIAQIQNCPTVCGMYAKAINTNPSKPQQDANISGNGIISVYISNFSYEKEYGVSFVVFYNE